MTDEELPLHTRFRPAAFEDMIGNDGVIASLNTALEDPKGINHAFIFHGPSGCGKTTLARILKTKLKVWDEDFEEINVASSRGIDTIRAINDRCSYAPLGGDARLFLLDEAHMLTTEAQNALLKTLEDAPAHSYFALCTTNPGKLIPTVRTRCSTYGVTSLPRMQIIKLLNRTYSEIYDDDPPAALLKEIAARSDGSPRQALVILGDVIHIEDPEKAMASVESVAVAEGTVIDLCRILKERKSKEKKWEECKPILQAIDGDPEQARRAILGYYAKVVLSAKGLSPIEVEIMECFADNFYDSGKAGLIIATQLACQL